MRRLKFSRDGQMVMMAAAAGWLMDIPDAEPGSPTKAAAFRDRMGGEFRDDCEELIEAYKDRSKNAWRGLCILHNHLSVFTGDVAFDPQSAECKRYFARRSVQADLSRAKELIGAALSGDTEAAQESGIIPDPHYGERMALVCGRRVYLGRREDTQQARIFWALARPVGRSHTTRNLTLLIDGIATDEDTGTKKEIQRAGQRVRTLISKLRGVMRENGADEHLQLINVKDEYSFVWKHGR